ncbi:MAG: rRNA pseudouridine synthase [Treponema sp.]|jgi:23S rRNA pseudouridine2605 synthase|nr:rRNA pseudouridine synthase [Treponema sp.]
MGEENSLCTEEKPLRLQVYLARAGVASRRFSEKLISAGRVQVNGHTVTLLGTKIQRDDRVCLDGFPLQIESRKHYLALHKPPGYICSAFDPQGRPLAGELLPEDIKERVYNVGRLDYRSSGLILFTNDGGFAAKTGHPRSGIEKEYVVEAAGPIPGQVVEAFEQGILIEGVHYRSTAIERLGLKTLRVVLVEGKNREIRRVFSYFHLHPAKLHRIRIGPVRLLDLAEGKSRTLTAEELRNLGI